MAVGGSHCVLLLLLLRSVHHRLRRLAQVLSGLDVKVLRWWGGTIEGWTGGVVGKAIGRRLLIRHGLSGSGLGSSGGKPATGDATSDVTSKRQDKGGGSRGSGKRQQQTSVACREGCNEWIEPEGAQWTTWIDRWSALPCKRFVWWPKQQREARNLTFSVLVLRSSCA